MEVRELHERLKRPEVVLGILLIFGFLIRIHGLDAASLWHDETVTANAATSLLQNGVPNFPSGFEYWRSFPHTLLVAVSAFFLGSSDFALRFPSVIVGVATIALTYFFGKEFYNERVGFVGAALMTFSNFHIAWSTQVRMYILLQFLFLGAVYLIYKCGEDFTPRNIILLFLTIVLAMATHVTAYILPIIAPVYFFYIFRPSISKRTAILVSLPLAALGFSEIFYFSYLNLFERFVFSSFNARFYLEWTVSNLPVLAALGISGAAVNFREDISTGLLSTISVFPAIYIFLFHVDGSAPRYLLFALPFLCLWTGLLVDFISKKLSESRAPVFSALAVLLVAGVAISSYTAAGSYSPSIDHESAYRYVEERGSGNEVLITQWSAPALHYREAPDYVLFSGKFNHSDFSYREVDRYSGAEFITNTDKLRNVVGENKEGWLVLSAAAYRFQSEETQEIIDSMDQRFKTNTLRVWHWNSSLSTFKTTEQAK